MTDPLIWNAAIKAAADSLVECSVWCDSQERTDASWHNGVIDARKHHTTAILALAKPSPDLRAAVAGMVVPLEWVTFDKGTCWAYCALGSYHVNERYGRFSVELVTGSMVRHIGRTNGTFSKDLDDAKAAAQADYTRRILAALGLEGGE